MTDSNLRTFGSSNPRVLESLGRTMTETIPHRMELFVQGCHQRGYATIPMMWLILRMMIKQSLMLASSIIPVACIACVASEFLICSSPLPYSLHMLVHSIIKGSPFKMSRHSCTSSRQVKHLGVGRGDMVA